VASVSGTILAVCSCTVLPIFAGIYLRGAGIGPATTFLYSGPAINVLAIVLTAKILGFDLGLARALVAIFGGIIIGLAMEFIFIKEEKTRFESIEFEEEKESLPLYKRISVLALLTGILVFATWGGKEGIAYTIYSIKWYLVSLFGIILGIVLSLWFNVSKMKIIFTILAVIILYLVISEKEISFLIGVLGFSYALSTTKGKMSEWFQNTYLLAKQILPLLFIGVFIAGLFFGRPGHEAIIPSSFVYALVGENSIFASFFASLMGVLMYFATLTEVPILQGLLGAGMGYGPALALLLSGPAVSLPSLLVLKNIWGPKKTLVYGALVLTVGSICGYLFGIIRG
jgi:Predicted permeases